MGRAWPAPLWRVLFAGHRWAGCRRLAWPGWPTAGMRERETVNPPPFGLTAPPLCVTVLVQ